MSAQWATGATADPRSGLADWLPWIRSSWAPRRARRYIVGAEQCWATQAIGIGGFPFDATCVADGIVSRRDILATLDRHDEAFGADVEMTRARFHMPETRHGWDAPIGALDDLRRARSERAP